MKQHQPDHPSNVGHIGRKVEITEGYVLGRPVRALCGADVVPSRDPDGLPLCEPCQRTLDALSHETALSA